ncbi:MAG TPA: hypothetical protein VLL28_16905, partial [Hyphomicrobiaceae bacterium]|nr:hypothetical protein [Hyphomicrobiaceae bacterium]
GWCWRGTPAPGPSRTSSRSPRGAGGLGFPEALAFINHDKRGAALAFLAMEGRGMTLEEVLEILNDADDADVRYTISPENILKYAGLWRPSAASNCARRAGRTWSSRR